MTEYYSSMSLEYLADMTLDEFSTLELTEPIVITNLGFASTAEVFSQSQYITQVFVSNHIEHFIIDSQNKQEVYP